MYSKLTFDEIEDCFPDDCCTDDKTGKVQVSAQWLHDFAHAIEAKLEEKNTQQVGWAVFQGDELLFIHKDYAHVHTWLTRGEEGRTIQPVFL